MKKLFSLLLVATITMLAFNSAKAQDVKYRTFTADVSISNFITDIDVVTDPANWSSAQTIAPNCPSGTVKLCGIRLEVTSGSLPAFAPPTTPNILDAIKTYFQTHSFPGCGAQFNLPVGSVTVKVTFLCKAS